MLMILAPVGRTDKTKLQRESHTDMAHNKGKPVHPFPDERRQNVL